MDTYERVMAKVRVGEGCWEWTGGTNMGYGQISVGNRPQRVHRIAYEHHFGLIPKGMLVCHRCDNRLCVNPAHLWLGTIADNVRDMWAKGRENLTNQVRGERVNTAKLTAADVVAIRADPRSSLRVAPDYGVSPSMVRQIRARTSWRHV
jgi:hypothetical protein